VRIDLQGRARVLGDDINADYIITSSRKRETIDASQLRHYLLETIDPAFAASVRDGDLLVAGRNFGCGSAMEVAATVILAAGIRAVIARSFARTFYRNAINNGLVPIECDTSEVREGDSLVVRFDGHRPRVENVSRGVTMIAPALPPIALAILDCGGLVEAVRRYGSLRALARNA
jgi:3-isopropylmalate/(R)-2-methylmalate dehydratase small subunit